MTPESLFPEPQESTAARIDAEISWLLLGHAGGPLELALEHDEREVLRLLRYRRGVAKAINLSELADKTRLSARQIKQAVRALRINFRLPIGSSKHSTDGGYYVMITPEDHAVLCKDFTDQIRGQVEVLRAVSGNHAALELLGQLALEVKQ